MVNTSSGDRTLSGFLQFGDSKRPPHHGLREDVVGTWKFSPYPKARAYLTASRLNFLWSSIVPLLAIILAAVTLKILTPDVPTRVASLVLVCSTILGGGIFLMHSSASGTLLDMTTQNSPKRKWRVGVLFLFGLITYFVTIACFLFAISLFDTSIDTFFQLAKDNQGKERRLIVLTFGISAALIMWTMNRPYRRDQEDVFNEVELNFTSPNMGTSRLKYNISANTRIFKTRHENPEHPPLSQPHNLANLLPRLEYIITQTDRPLEIEQTGREKDGKVRCWTFRPSRRTEIKPADYILFSRPVLFLLVVSCSFPLAPIVADHLSTDTLSPFMMAVFWVLGGAMVWALGGAFIHRRKRDKLFVAVDCEACSIRHNLHHFGGILFNLTLYFKDETDIGNLCRILEEIQKNSAGPLTLKAPG